MSGRLPDNALLERLQDERNDDHRSDDDLASMYNYFAEGANVPITLLKEDDHYHCFIVFQKDSTNNSHCTMLHHLAQYPTRMGITTPFDGNWYLSGDQPMAGNQIHYILPGSLFTPQPGVQLYSLERIQREVGPGISQLTMAIGDEDLEEAELITTRRGMWIPNCYAALCLEDGLSPVDVWNRIYGASFRIGTLPCAPPWFNTYSTSYKAQ